MLTIESMSSGRKKDGKSKEAEKAEMKYDAWVFAIEIAVTLLLLAIIFVVFDL